MEHEYPLRPAPPRGSHSRDWPSFHAHGSFEKFLRLLPESDRERHHQRKQALMRTVLSAEFYDAEHLREASYGNK